MWKSIRGIWKSIKRIYDRISLITLAFSLVVFFLVSFLTFIVEGAKGTMDSMTFISLLAVLFSFPGLVNTIAGEYNPKKKTFKLSCNCPKCKHLIQMDMKEE